MQRFNVTWIISCKSIRQYKYISWFSLKMKNNNNINFTLTNQEKTDYQCVLKHSPMNFSTLSYFLLWIIEIKLNPWIELYSRRKILKSNRYV